MKCVGKLHIDTLVHACGRKTRSISYASYTNINSDISSHLTDRSLCSNCYKESVVFVIRKLTPMVCA